MITVFQVENHPSKFGALKRCEDGWDVREFDTAREYAEHIAAETDLTPTDAGEYDGKIEDRGEGVCLAFREPGGSVSLLVVREA